MRRYALFLRYGAVVVLVVNIVVQGQLHWDVYHLNKNLALRKKQLKTIDSIIAIAKPTFIAQTHKLMKAPATSGNSISIPNRKVVIIKNRWLDSIAKSDSAKQGIAFTSALPSAFDNSFHFFYCTKNDRVCVGDKFCFQNIRLIVSMDNGQIISDNFSFTNLSFIRVNTHTKTKSNVFFNVIDNYISGGQIEIFFKQYIPSADDTGAPIAYTDTTTAMFKGIRQGNTIDGLLTGYAPSDNGHEKISYSTNLTLYLDKTRTMRLPSNGN